MTILVLDLETVVDESLPVLPPDDDGKPVFPPPGYHQIVSFGALVLNDDYTPIKIGRFGEGGTESDALVRFAEAHSRSGGCWLITWNGRGFDLPVITHRCLRHGVPLRSYYQPARGCDPRYRYSDGGQLDLKDYLSDYGAARPMKLDAAARLVGLPGKGDVDGSDVATMWREGREEEVHAYCLEDVAQTGLLLLRVQLLRGLFSKTDFQRAGGALLDFLAADGRVAGLASRVDRERYLLGSVSS